MVKRKLIHIVPVENEVLWRDDKFLTLHQSLKYLLALINWQCLNRKICCNSRFNHGISISSSMKSWISLKWSVFWIMLNFAKLVVVNSEKSIVNRVVNRTTHMHFYFTLQKNIFSSLWFWIWNNNFFFYINFLVSGAYNFLNFFQWYLDSEEKYWLKYSLNSPETRLELSEVSERKFWFFMHER